jgi:TPP-dependent 2-oxoacid decarboxylase
VYLGQRQRAQDTAAYTLVRNALTAVQTAFVDTGDYTLVTLDDLTAIESSIDWVVCDDDLVGTAPAFIKDPIGAEARRQQVAVHCESKTVVDLASLSASGNSFGIQVDALDLTETGYVKVKDVDGSVSVGW